MTTKVLVLINSKERYLIYEISPLNIVLIPLNTVSVEVGIKANKLNLSWYLEIRRYVPVTK